MVAVVLLHSLWQAGLVALAFMSFGQFVPRARARLRYRAACLALLAIAVFARHHFRLVRTRACFAADASHGYTASTTANTRNTVRRRYRCRTRERSGSNARQRHGLPCTAGNLYARTRSLCCPGWQRRTWSVLSCSACACWGAGGSFCDCGRGVLPCPT